MLKLLFLFLFFFLLVYIYFLYGFLFGLHFACKIFVENFYISRLLVCCFSSFILFFWFYRLLGKRKIVYVCNVSGAVSDKALILNRTKNLFNIKRIEHVFVKFKHHLHTTSVEYFTIFTYVENCIVEK